MPQWPNELWTPLELVKWFYESQGKSGNIYLWGLQIRLAMRLARSKDLSEPLDRNEALVRERARRVSTCPYTQN